MKKYFRNFLLLSTLTTASIYAINKAISISSTIKNILKTDNGRFYEWRYGNIFYTKQGKGSPLLLIHDLNPADSNYEWSKTINQLSKSHTVYAVDLLGCGRSDKPNLTYTNFLYVQLVNDFIKNVIGEKTDIIAMGDSSSFSIMACNMSPEYFKKIILVNPTDINKLCAIPSKRKNVLKLLIDAPIIGTLIYNIVYSNKNIYNTFFKDYYYKNHLISTKMIDTFYESAHINNSRGKYLLSSIKANYTNINISHALKKINHSIFVLCSKENDQKNIVDSYMELNPSIEFSYISDSKYVPQLESPKQFIDHVLLFLNS